MLQKSTPKTKSSTPKGSLKVEQIKFCSSCAIYLDSSEEGTHFNNAHSSDGFSVGCLNALHIEEIRHPFIAWGLLTGKLAKAEGHISQHHDSMFSTGTVFLHPETMVLAGFRAGQHVVVNHAAVGYLWPDDKLPLLHVGLSPKIRKNLNLTDGSCGIVYGISEIDVEELIVSVERDIPICRQKSFPELLMALLDGQFVSLNDKLMVNILLEEVTVTVQALKPRKQQLRTHSSIENSHLKLSDRKVFFRITLSTVAKVERPNSITASQKPQSLPQFTGYRKQLNELKELMDRVFMRDGVHQACGVPSGVVVHGTAGCGKSLLWQHLVELYRVEIVQLNSLNLWSKFVGESEGRLRSMFRDARAKSPCLLIIEDLHVICPRLDRCVNDTQQKVITIFIQLLDQLVCEGCQVLVVGVTNALDDVEPAVRSSGRLDKEILLTVPTPKDRTQILSSLLTGVQHTLHADDVEHVSSFCHGFTGSDLLGLCKEATCLALAQRLSLDLTAEDDKTVTVSLDHLLAVLPSVRPASVKEVALEIPQVRWSDIGGQEDLKHKLRQAVEWPLKHPEAFQRLGIKPPKGLLMYGPPGCSKTMIAKALARESGLNFISITGPELFSKWVGESERAVREVFRRARTAAPAIVFFDEIDALATHRASGADVADRILAQLLTEIDGVSELKDVTILAATNRPDRIDEALMRPGRLDRIVYIPLPDVATREQILRIHCQKMPVGPHLDQSELVRRTHGYTGAELRAVSQEAAMCALREDLDSEHIEWRHFEMALSRVKPGISEDVMKFYEQFSKSHEQQRV